MPRTKEQKNNYMKKWRIKHKDRLNKENREKLQKMKDENPEEYKEFRRKSNISNEKYFDNNKDSILKNKKEKNWYYDKEKRIDIRKRSYMKNPASNVLRQRKAQSKRKGIPFELDVEWYNTEWAKGCCMTGRSFDEHGSDTSLVAHIDKKIPSLGYTKENCRLVCASYNLAKKHWTDKDVLDMAEALIKHINNNKITRNT